MPIWSCGSDGTLGVRLDTTSTQLGTGTSHMQPGTDIEFTADVRATVFKDEETSALGGDYCSTPLVLPTRGHLDSVKRLLKGDVYIGRGSRQRSLKKSRFCNNYNVSVHGRDVAIARFREMLLQDEALLKSRST